jgi:hypothetical protein
MEFGETAPLMLFTAYRFTIFYENSEKIAKKVLNILLLWLPTSLS